MIIDQLFTSPLFESQMDPITQFASNAHEQWRGNFDPTGTKPRIKKNSDGTEGDINVPFADLHPDWQKENLAAGHAAHRAVKHFGHDMEKAAEYVHSEWMKRNPKADYNAAQHVPYDDLSDDEKEKDRVHVRTMMKLMGHHPKQGVTENTMFGDDQAFIDLITDPADKEKYINQRKKTKDIWALSLVNKSLRTAAYSEIYKLKDLKKQLAKKYNIASNVDDEEQGVAEVAPPGDKAERMVRHIKQGYARDGKLTPKEKGIAFATAWKAHNAGQVEEGEITKNTTGLKHRATDKYGAGDDEPHHYTGGRSGFSEPGKYARDLEHVNKQLVKDLDASMGISWKNRGPKGLEVDEQGVAEDTTDDLFNMRVDDPRIKRNQDITALAKEIYAQMVAERGQPMDRRQQQTWMAIAQTKAAAQLSNTAPQTQNDVPAQKPLPAGKPLPGEQTDSFIRKSSTQWESQGVAKGRQIDEVFADQGSGSTDRDNADYMKRRRAANKAGYTGRETKAGTWRVFKDGNAVAAAGPFKSADEAAAWIKKHKQGITEMDKSQTPPGRDGDPRPGPEKIAKPISQEKMVKHALDTLSKSMAKKDDKKKDVKESDTLMIKLKRAMVQEGRVKELADDLKTMSDADFMKKYGKAKAAIRKDMSRVDEARTDYTPDEMADMLSGKRSQKQIDADAERTRGPNKAPPTKESTQSRANRLNEKLATSDTLASGSGISRLGKKDIEPKLDFRTGLDVGDDESEFFEPDVRIGKPVEPDKADTDAFMSAVDSYGEQNPYMQSWGGKYADQDTRVAPLRPGEFNVGGTTWRRVEDPKKEVQWIPSSEADSIASWKANNPGKSAADWGPASIPAASKSSAAGGAPKTRWNVFTHEIEKLDPRTGTWTKMSDGSGANPNIDAATRDRARAWAAQQNAPGAALAGAMRSSGNPVDTAKKKTDWKSIYNLNKSIIGDNPNSIKPGMKLKMPDGSIYPVQPGDNLTKIAAKQSQVMSEAPKSAAVRLGNAIKRVQGTTAASQARSVIPSSIPKPEPKKDEKDEKEAKKVDESRAARRALMARIVNGG